ncbi:extracellular solute-binding protein [Arthrobacter echini]|uniref:Extracellular solute-binding protein n=1 Tax=Arthrobacter echini TaxID=1529066 RepID=A0A4S5E6F7_9MICC|nr:extracellular solute-binding protein [Arthrobacter echini]THJ67141.1 extracellular solute-binding protein [Arthrobacter echini]
MTPVTRTKRAALLATVGFLSLGLASCGDSSTEADAPSESDPVTITYTHRLPDGEGMTTVQEQVDEWNAANPGIQVEPTKFDGEAAEMSVRLETDINAGNGPCLAQMGYAEVPEAYVKGLLADVTEEAAAYEEDFSEGARGLMQVGDATVGLPQDIGPLVYYYNETEFENLGIEVPTNLDEFRAAAETAAADGKNIAAFMPDEGQYWLSAQAAAAGDTWFSTNGDAWVVNANGDGAQNVASLWQDLLDNDEVLVQQRWGDGFTQALTDGTLIGHVGAAWEAGFLLDDLDGTEAEGQWRVAQLPDYGNGVMSGPDGGSGVAVMDGCENPEAALEFLDWLNTSGDFLASQGLVPAADIEVETPEKMTRQFGGQDVMGELAVATENLNPDFPYAPGFSSLVTMSEEASNVAAGDAQVTDIFETAQTTAVATLENLGLPVSE